MKYVAICSLLMLCCAPDTRVADVDPGNYSSENAEALQFCQRNGLNQQYYFLVDLKRHSGKNRFFVYDFKQKQITDGKLVTHGACDVPVAHSDRWQKARFSNTTDSHCSAQGKYRIGARDKSSWGIKIKYWLHGLEKTNDNAQERVIVLHSWEAVSDAEIYPNHSPLSWGCPAVSDAFMKKLDAKLQNADKPVLLWILE